MPATKDFVGVQKDRSVALPNRCPGRLHTRACYGLLEMVTTTGGTARWQTQRVSKFPFAQTHT